MKFLLVNLNHIGDLLFTLPAVDALLERYPNAEIVHLVSKATLPLIQEDPRFSEVVPRSKSDVKEWVRIALDLRKRHRFDAAINFCRNSFGLGAVTWLSGAPLRIGFSGASDTQLFFNRRLSYDDSLHRIERNVSLLSPLGITPDPIPPMRLYLQEERKRAAKDRLAGLGEGPWIALCVGASVERKKWMLDRYVAVAERLHEETGARFSLIGGKEDEADAELFLSQARVPAQSFCGTVGLMESAALLSICDLAIGGDTGPLQLAIAVGAPVIALFGSTEPRRTGLFHAPGELVFHRQPCCGCSPSVPCPLAIRCMTDITVEEVTTTALRVLNSAQVLS
jgi:lipopolysaccharide heptosyltransferase II